MKYFFLTLILLLAKLSTAQSEIRLRSHPLANAAVGASPIGLFDATDLYHIIHSDFFGYQTWRIWGSGIGFQFNPGIVLYEQYNPAYDYFADQHMGRTDKSFWSLDESHRISPIIKTGPTCLLSQIGKFQLHGFVQYAIYLRRWRIREHTVRGGYGFSYLGPFEEETMYHRIYKSSAKMISPFHHFRLGLTSLFTVNESLCSISAWAEIHPPYTYRYEVTEMASRPQTNATAYRRSSAELLMGVGIQFHDVSGWKVLKDIL